MEKLLILGGTQFIGKNLTEALLKLNKYDITIFNRGKTKPHLFPNVKRIIGDRNTDDIFKISQQKWDYVIDVSCYYPNSLDNLLTALDGNVKRMVFVSTCSVYDDSNQKITLYEEDTPVFDCKIEERTDTSDATYGKRKAECERILQQSNLDYIAFRPALVYGPSDHSDRFYYWIYQVLNNDPLLIPDNGGRLISLTYVHDLVSWIIEALTIENHAKVYNAITVPTTSIGQIIQNIEKLQGQTPSKINASPSFLNQNNISQWTDMPLWVDYDYIVSQAKLSTDFESPATDFQESVSATIEFYRALNFPIPKYGMNEKRRQELLDKILNH